MGKNKSFKLASAMARFASAVFVVSLIMVGVNLTSLMTFYWHWNANNPITWNGIYIKIPEDKVAIKNQKLIKDGFALVNLKSENDAIVTFSFNEPNGKLKYFEYLKEINWKSIIENKCSLINFDCREYTLKKSDGKKINYKILIPEKNILISYSTEPGNIINFSDIISKAP